MGIYDEVIEQIGGAGAPSAPPLGAPPAAPPADTAPPETPPETPERKGMYGYSDEFQKAYGKK